MNWSRLKDAKCPQCQGNILLSVAAFSCDKKCGFVISQIKFNEIVLNMYKKKSSYKVPNEEDNLSSLNNLNHAGISDDFSDSPHLNR